MVAGNLSAGDQTVLNRFLYGSLPAARENISSGYGNLLGSTQARRQDANDRYAMLADQITGMQATSSQDINSAYGSAANRVQNAPTFYQQPSAVAPAMTVPMVGADAATMSALNTQAAGDAAANQQNIDFMYNMLNQSDVANRASRLSDIDLARSNDLAALSALGQAQQFGLGQAQSAELAAIDDLLAEIQREQIAADLGLTQTELSVGQQAVTANQNAMNTAVDSFAQMITPIVDLLDPISVIELWTEFAAQLGIPASQAMGMIQ